MDKEKELIDELTEEDIKTLAIISNFRKLASDNAVLMKECFEKSQNEFRTGDKGLAKKLADEGRVYKEKIAENNNLAMTTAFNYKNKGKELNEIDLHCLLVDEAIKLLTERIETIKSTNISSLIVIHGQGKHSDVKMESKIKQACYRYLDQNKIFFSKECPNPGCLTISFFC